MTSIIIIAVVIAALVLIGKLKNKKTDNVISSPSTVQKYISVENLMRRANEKEIVKDYRSAVAIADKILLLQPDNYSALTCRANSLAALNFNLDAIDDYEKALLIYKSDANIYGLLGLTYAKIGSIDSGQKNLRISIEKGLKVYEMYYNMLLSVSEEVKQVMISRGNIQENLQKRNPNDFVDNLSSVDKEEFKESLKNQIHKLEGAISLDPNNTELRELYEFTKRQIE